LFESKKGKGAAEMEFKEEALQQIILEIQEIKVWFEDQTFRIDRETRKKGSRAEYRAFKAVVSEWRLLLLSLYREELLFACEGAQKRLKTTLLISAVHMESCATLLKKSLSPETSETLYEANQEAVHRILKLKEKLEEKNDNTRIKTGHSLFRRR
jgi:hypothetical protein